MKFIQKILLSLGLKKNSLFYNILKYFYLFLQNKFKKLSLYLKKIRFYFSDYVVVQKFSNYDLYLNKQLEKTTNVLLRKGWLEKNNYENKTEAFINFFKKNKKIISNAKKTLAIGARLGNEVIAIRSYGTECIGVDIVPYGNFVIKGDMHNLPFEDNNFDFVFTNILDHSVYPKIFFSEVKRVLKKNGYFLIHMLIDFDNDEYSVTNITNINQMKKLAKDFKVVKIYDTDFESLSFFHFNKEFLFQK